jgi:hypothetical protein
MRKPINLTCEWCESNGDDVVDHIIDDCGAMVKVIICLGCYQMYNNQIAYDREVS